MKANHPFNLITPNAWLYADDYDLAGFVFADIEGVVCPIDSFQLSGDIDQTLDDLLVSVKEKHGIEWVMVPRVLPGNPTRGEEARANLLYQDVPCPPFNRTFIGASPSFRQARLIRAKALRDGTLSESHYKGRQKLLERLKQVNEDRPPNALLWAYLYGLYDLLRTRRKPRPKPSYQTTYYLQQP